MRRRDEAFTRTLEHLGRPAKAVQIGILLCIRKSMNSSCIYVIDMSEQVAVHLSRTFRLDDASFRFPLAEVPLFQCGRNSQIYILVMVPS